MFPQLQRYTIVLEPRSSTFKINLHLRANYDLCIHEILLLLTLNFIIASSFVAAHQYIFPEKLGEDAEFLKLKPILSKAVYSIYISVLDHELMLHTNVMRFAPVHGTSERLLALIMNRNSNVKSFYYSTHTLVAYTNRD